MKNNVLKYYITAFYFCSTFVLFAQPGDGNGGTGDGGLEGGGDTTPGAPIDDYLWFLGLAALAIVFCSLRLYTKKENNSK